MAGSAASANVSMILTPPARLTDSKPWWGPAATAATGAEASHNGHCVTLEPCPRYNMSHRKGRRRRWHGHCLYNNQTRQTSRESVTRPKGEGEKARDSKKAWVRVSRMAQPDTVSLNNNEKTLLHTQASDRTPRHKRGGFFVGVGKGSATHRCVCHSPPVTPPRVTPGSRT